MPAAGMTMRVGEVNRLQESAWDRLNASKSLGTEATIHFRDIPWPDMPGHGGANKVVFYALEAIRHPRQTDGPAALRRLRMRWHPDKFIQSWGARLASDDHAKVMRRVNDIAQLINATMDR